MSNKKIALGRGLGALLESNKTAEANTAAASEVSQNGIAEVEIIAIEVNPFQPRTQFDQTALEELSSSIKQYGLIQPITLRKMGYGKFQLISGERRFRASQLAGLTSIPAYIRLANDQEMLEMALVENIQRESLDPIEISLSYQRLIEECKVTQEELSDRVGKQRSTISNYLRLLKLPAEIQSALRKKLISMGHARSIINIDDAEVQLKMFADIIKGEMSVRDAEKMVSNYSGKKEKGGSSTGTQLSYGVQKVNNELVTLLNAKVEIKKSKKGKGSITIPFNSENEFSRIVKLILTRG